MKKIARYFEDKFVTLFAPEGEDQDVSEAFDRELFGASKRL